VDPPGEPEPGTEPPPAETGGPAPARGSGGSDFPGTSKP